VSNQTDVVLRDLAGEVAALSQLLSGLSDNQWSAVTPAEGWNVADQVIHLGLFDQRCLWSMVDEERFRTDRQEMSVSGGVEGLQNSHRGRSPEELFAWWRDGAQELAHAALSVDLSKRCAIYVCAINVDGTVNGDMGARIRYRRRCWRITYSH